MRAKWFFVIAAFAAVALGTAQTALADNDATGSVGAVQTGPIGVTPTADATQAGATAAASVPVAVGGSGDNTATDSVGAVQAGGGNTSSNSTGSVQVSSVSASPSASAGASGSSASAGVPLTRSTNGPGVDVPFTWRGLRPATFPHGVARVSRFPPVKRSTTVNDPAPASSV